MAGLDGLAVQLRDLSVRLQELGDRGLEQELARAIGDAVDPLKDRIRAQLKPDLPDRYAEELDADLAITQRTSGSADSSIARVTILARTRSGKRRRLHRLDDGVLAHPLWGNRRHWRNQEVTAGFFTRTAEDSAPEIRDAIEAALRDVAGKAAGR